MYLEESVMRGWRLLHGDVAFKEYGAKWFRHVHDERYHVIELINWIAETGEGEHTYCVALQEIDLEWMDAQMAIDGMGYADYLDEADPIVQVEAISEYGNYAPMGHWDGNNYRKLLAIAKRESKALEDSGYHYQQMSRPVNQIGSTAYEAARGDFTSGMIRSIAHGDEGAKIMGKMYGWSEDGMDSLGEEHKDFTLSPILDKGDEED